MAISIASRIRKSMVGLVAILCTIFAGLIFLLVYIIEDQVFVNQLKVEQSYFEDIVETTSPASVAAWQPVNRNIVRVNSVNALAQKMPDALLDQVFDVTGIHELFDEQHAVFIAHIARPELDSPVFLIYDVTEVLAVRGAKLPLVLMIVLLSLTIFVFALLLARWLARTTLAPVSRLSDALQNDDFDDAIIALANEFKRDEIGILARELAESLRRVQVSARREYEFNRGVSHELRSPMQIALSASDVLGLLTKDEDEGMSTQILRLQRAIRELNEIAESFMWLASDRQIRLEEWSVPESVKTKILELNLLHSSKSLLVQQDTSTVCRYPMPETVMMVVLRSLVRNALTHGSGDAVEISLKPNQVVVTNEFRSDQQPDKGFGIGLSIASRLSDRFGASLTTEATINRVYVATLQFDPNNRL